MNRADRVLSQTDPARHLGSMLDQRAEAELAALTGAEPATTSQAVRQQHTRRPKRLQPVLTTALVATVVAAVSVTVVVNSPAQQAIGGRGVPTATPLASSSIVSTASPGATPGPVGAYSGPLIALEGARSWTREQLHARLSAAPGPEDPANAAVGEEQDWLNIQCMAIKGYLYDPFIDGTFTIERGKTYGLTPEQHRAYLAAFWGQAHPRTTMPYDWRTAGCQGRSVHLTGQDDAH